METITPEIAELAGIYAADGSMQEDHICFWGNITEDKDHYDKTIKPLFKKSFSINVNPHAKPSNSVYGFYVCKKPIIRYFNKVLKYPKGSKTYIVKVPDRVIRSEDPKVWSTFIRGFTDADGCLNFDKKYGKGYRKILTILHTYPRIQLKSVSFTIIREISQLLDKLGIQHIVCKIKRSHIEEINEQDYLLLQISGKECLERWMKIIGFNNPVQRTRYDIFKKHGFVPHRTTLAERKGILEGINNPLDFYPKEEREKVLDGNMKLLGKSI